jgi:hypothetical protein
MAYTKRAAKFLPKDLQDAINTFIEQFNIMLEHNLDTIPTEYTVNLFKVLSKYPEYNKDTLDLIRIFNKR